MKNTNRTYKLALIGLMAAAVFICTYIHLDIPTPLGKTMLHFGNVMCLLGGLLFGPVIGGLAAGIGSMFFDMFDPVFLPECWITFILKFAMGFIAGAIAHGFKMTDIAATGKLKARQIAAAIIGALCYTCLYVGKTIVVNYFVLGTEWPTVWATVITKGTVSLVNAVVASVASLLLYAALRPALSRAKLFETLAGPNS